MNPTEKSLQQARELVTRFDIPLTRYPSLHHYIALALDAAKAEQREEDAKICEKRAEERFHEHGVTEPDTNASYYPGESAEYDIRDEEDADCAAAIRKGGVS